MGGVFGLTYMSGSRSSSRILIGVLHFSCQWFNAVADQCVHHKQLSNVFHFDWLALSCNAQKMVVLLQSFELKTSKH